MGRFHIREVPSGYKFDLLAANGQVIVTSEVYETRVACEKGTRSVIACAAKGRVADLTEEKAVPANPRFEIYRDKLGQYRFRLRSRNGQIVAVSESYTGKTACENGVQSVIANTKKE